MVYMVNGIDINLSRFDKKIATDRCKQLRQSLDIPENATVLIYCAELIKNKNQKLLLDALKIILTTKNDVYLYWPG